MINVVIFKDPSGAIKGFTAENHADSKVCAAVTMLTINTVNSIETFTNADFTCELIEEGGYLSFTLSSDSDQHASLLLNAMELGLTMASEEYPAEISIKQEPFQEPH